MRVSRSSHAVPFIPDRGTGFESIPSAGARRSSQVRAPLGLRLRVRLTHHRLDRQISAGDPFEETPEMALRARQLAEPRTQQEIARNLRRAMRYAERQGSRGALSCVVTRPSAVRAGKPALAELAEQLERGGSVNPRGVVLATTLLTDAASPLFDPHCERAVSEAVREVQHALEEAPRMNLGPLAATFER
jgi:hypothetical protein